MVEKLTIIFTLAIFVEAVMEYFISNPEKKQPWLRYISALLGILVCVAYKVDLLSLLGAVSPYAFVGEVFTGLIVGRGSNYLNDFMNRVRNPISAVSVESPATVNTQTTTVL